MTNYLNELPCIDVIPLSNGRYKLIDGFHRIDAFILKRRKTVNARILSHRPNNSDKCYWNDATQGPPEYPGDGYFLTVKQKAFFEKI